MANQRITYLLTLLCSGVYYILSGAWLSRLLFWAVLGLPWVSLLLSLPAILSFRACAEADSAILQQKEETPLWLQGDCRFPLPPFRGTLEIRSCITGKELSCGEDFSSKHCGGFLAEPKKVRICDYLGLFSFRSRKNQTARILVHPAPLPVRDLMDPQFFEAQRWIPKPGGGFSEHHELRPYRPGDSLNQIHWKLSSKAGTLILREPMEPVHGSVQLSFALQGSSAEIDRKFGRLLWVGQQLLEHELEFTVLALTGEGWLSFQAESEEALMRCIDTLLCKPKAAENPPTEIPADAAWHYRIGGDADAE